MRIEFLLGPAGTGKTFRCVDEARQALKKSCDGLPLVFLAPKQATYQVERQLLDTPSLAGYTRLHIFSFERLCRWIFKQARQPEPKLLNEEGRIMVLRALLTRYEGKLQVFRATARSAGFARQLSRLIREFQQSRITVSRLRELADQAGEKNRLRGKLNDLALLLESYRKWLNAEQIEDSDQLIELATDALERSPDIKFGEIWLDGFARLTSQEQRLLKALASRSDKMTLAFCLDPDAGQCPWHSHWFGVEQSFGELRAGLSCMDGAEVVITNLGRELGDRDISQLSPALPMNRAFDSKAPGLAEAMFPLTPALSPGEREPAGPFTGWMRESPVGGILSPLRGKEESPPGRVPVEGIRLKHGPPLSPIRGEGEQLPVLGNRADGLGAGSAAHKRNAVRSVFSRFANGELKHLEAFWAEPRPYTGNGAVRLVECADPEAEALFAAREVLRYVRQGGRFRDVAVIVRELENYHDVLRRVFLRYEIPFFLDRREPIAHHPLAELIRGSLRTLAYNWRQRDLFCALKSGLLPATEDEIDRLENEALARGWEGETWLRPITIRDDIELSRKLEALRKAVAVPLQALGQQPGLMPTGKELSEALAAFWNDLQVERQLEQWCLDSIEQGRLHHTVWEQVQQWAQDLALAFRDETRTLKDWIPILESGLENLSIGVIPPVLDQVLLGAVDRSRNPDLQCVIVLGLNDGIFPAQIETPPILSELDREILEDQCRVSIGSDSRTQTAQERFFGYIACTRARERLVLTYAARDLQGNQLNPSSLVTHIQRLFPALKTPERFARPDNWPAIEHSCEAIAPLLKARVSTHVDRRMPDQVVTSLGNLPHIAPILSRLELASPQTPKLSSALAQALYGRVHPTSVSALEKFGACPFQFFIDSGLEAKERNRFQLDPRQSGTFQHEVLEQFHHALKARGQTWHTISAANARELVGRTADALIETFNEGMLKATHENRFLAQQKKERLQRFVEVLVGWMQSQYTFEPEVVELAFGLDETLPAWKIDAFDGYSLALRGCVDRVDVCRPESDETAWCVVMDYKSGGKDIDEILMAHGIQLQLPGYLAALRGIEGVPELLKAKKLRLAGIFFVNLSGKYQSVPNRSRMVADPWTVHKAAFNHDGRFDVEALPFLDSRDVPEGDQFNYKRRLDGQFNASVKGPLAHRDFQQLLESTEEQMRQFGRKIYEGVIDIAPYKKGSERACVQCEHAPICRIDPWAHDFGERNLKKALEADEEEE